MCVIFRILTAGIFRSPKKYEKIVGKDFHAKKKFVEIFKKIRGSTSKKIFFWKSLPTKCFIFREGNGGGIRKIFVPPEFF